jgi:hypothetical protein
MTRVVLENILLFLLPSLVYVAYVRMMRPDKNGGQRGLAGAARVLDDAPLLWLFAAGALLVIVTLVMFGSSSGGKPGQHYEPPVLKNDRIEPGHID